MCADCTLPENYFDYILQEEAEQETDLGRSQMDHQDRERHHPD